MPKNYFSRIYKYFISSLFIFLFSFNYSNAQVLDSLVEKQDIPIEYFAFHFIGNPVLALNYGRYFGLKQTKNRFTKHDVHGGLGFLQYIYDEEGLGGYTINAGYGYTIGNKRRSFKIGYNNIFGKYNELKNFKYFANPFVEMGTEHFYFNLALRFNSFIYNKPNYFINDASELIKTRSTIIRFMPGVSFSRKF